MLLLNRTLEWRQVYTEPAVWLLGEEKNGHYVTCESKVQREKDGSWLWWVYVPREIERYYPGHLQGREPSRALAQEIVESVLLELAEWLAQEIEPFQSQVVNNGLENV